MKALLAVLVVCGSVWAQPVYGPYTVWTSDSLVKELEVCVRDDTADVLWIEDDQVLYGSTALSNPQHAPDPLQIMVLHTWRTLQIGEVIALDAMNLACLVYQDELGLTEPPYAGMNRIDLCLVQQGQVITVPLDSGYNTWHFPQFGYGGRSGFSLTELANGDVGASWVRDFFLTYDSDVHFCMSRVAQIGEVTMSAFGTCGLFSMGQVNKTFLSDLRFPTLLGITANEFAGLSLCQVDTVFEDYYIGCGWFGESQVSVAQCLHFGATSDTTALLVYTEDDWAAPPRLASLQLSWPDRTVVVDSLGEIGLSFVHSSFFHPSYGFAAIEVHPSRLLLARIDTTGQAVHPVGVLHEFDGTSHPIECDVTITDDGKVVAVWSELAEGEDAPRTIKIAWVNWTTYLGADDSPPALPASLSLSAYPNPFNSSVKIEYEIAKAGEIELSVFNTLGQKVETLFEGNASLGKHELAWSPSGSSGVYFVKLESGDVQESRKILYLK